jgi:hypothetical protein
MGDFDHISKAIWESPVTLAFKEMAESGDFSRLEKNPAKRHHYVPQFILRGFAADPNDQRRLYQMPTTGSERPVLVGIRHAAVREWLYRAFDEDGKPTNRHEGYLSLIEEYAAPAIGRMLAAPGALTPGDRATIASHVAFQLMRSPAAAEQVTALANMALQTAASEIYSDRAAFAVHYREEQGAEASDEEIERFRLELLESVREGKVTVSGRNGADFAAAFDHANDNIPVILSFDWLLLRTPDGGFVASDRGYAIHDLAPRAPWAAQGLLSSQYTETLVPLCDTAALLLRPGAEMRLGEHEVSNEELMALNLLTFGWASGYVFSTSEATLDALRAAAAARPEDVIRPRPFCTVVGIERDPDDDALAQENLARGWPAYYPGRDGKLYDYLVIPVDAPHPELHRRADELTELRARKRAGLAPDDPVEGRIVHELLDPEDLPA